MNKKNLILGGILILLLAIAYLYQGPLQDLKNKIGKPKNFLASLDTAQVSRIEVEREGETVIIDKVGDKWLIAGTKDFYLTDDVASNLTNFLQGAVKADVEVVSENQSKKSEFNADEDSGILVKLMQDELVFSAFIVGKLASDFTSTYISQPAEAKTYLVKANLSSAFDHDSWYNKEIFSAEVDKINKLRFQYPTSEFTLEKNEEGEWGGVLPYIFRVDKEKVEEIVNTMANLRAVEIPEQTFEGTGLEKHSIIVQATGEETSNTIMIGDANIDGYYFAKKSASDNIYLITKEEKETLETSIRDLR